MKIYRHLLLILICFVTSSISKAHLELNQDPFDLIERYGTLLERISHLQTRPDDRPPRAAVPVVKIGGKRVALDMEFMRLVEDISRIYVNDIQELCADCQLPEPEKIRAKAEELLANGWMNELGERTGNVIMVRYGGEFIDLGARLGVAFGVAKVAGELAEEALLAMTKAYGLHVLCEAITYVIAYYGGRVLSTVRTGLNASRYGKFGLPMIVKEAAVTWVTRRSLEKIQLMLNPMQIHPQLLEGGWNEQGEWLSQEIKEEARFEKFLKYLEKQTLKYEQDLLALQLTDGSVSDRDLKARDRKIRKIQRKIMANTKIHRKVFEGRRYGLSLFLFKRKRRLHHVYSDELEMNPKTYGTSLWVVPLTTTILEPGLQIKPEFEPITERWGEILQQRLTPRNSEIENQLLTESSELGIDPGALEKLFADINIIYDSRIPKKERMARVLMIEGFLSYFVPSLTKDFVQTIREEKGPDGNGKFKNFFRWSNVRWKTGRITFYSNQFVDALRLVAVLPKGRVDVLEREYAKDYLVRVFKALQMVPELRLLQQASEVDIWRDLMSEELYSLRSGRFWLEKRAAINLLPIQSTLSRLFGLGHLNRGRARVQCEKLYH